MYSNYVPITRTGIIQYYDLILLLHYYLLFTHFGLLRIIIIYFVLFYFGYFSGDNIINCILLPIRPYDLYCVS